MEIRAKAAEATRLKYKDRPFVWGKVDCIKMCRSHAMAMGHKLPKPPRYTSAIGAKRALTKMGHESVEQLLASYFPQITPAAARLGDIVIGEGEHGLDAAFIWTGRKLMGFHEDAETLVMILPEQVKTAFRL